MGLCLTAAAAGRRFPTWNVVDDELEWVHTSTVRGFAKVPAHLR